jgi:hypothetical protein
MKNIFKSGSITAVLLLVSVLLFFNSCSETTEDVTTRYTIGFVSAEFTDVAEFNRIDSAYVHSIGVAGDEFTLNGTTAENDAKVKAGCVKAQTFLNTLTFKGYYELRVMRGTNEIHVAVYGTKKAE